MLTGCATMLSGSSQNINVDSNVRGANVYINGVNVGKTPFSGQIERKSSMELKVSKKGYRSRTLLLNTEIEGTFWVNIFSMGVFGSTTDAASGSMWKISPNTYNVDLEKKGLGE